MAENSSQWCQQPGACKSSRIARHLCHACDLRRRWANTSSYPVWRMGTAFYVEIGRGHYSDPTEGVSEIPVVIYRSLDDEDGGKYKRKLAYQVMPVAEFEDGRFERVSK